MNEMIRDRQKELRKMFEDSVTDKGVIPVEIETLKRKAKQEGRAIEILTLSRRFKGDGYASGNNENVSEVREWIDSMTETIASKRTGEYFKNDTVAIVDMITFGKEGEERGMDVSIVMAWRGRHINEDQ